MDLFQGQQDGDESLTSIRNVCGKRYLYSPKQPNGERTWELEHKLSDVEALLGKVWPLLATNFADLSSEHIRKAVSLFVALMHLRHPDARKDVEQPTRTLCTSLTPYRSLAAEHHSLTLSKYTAKPISSTLRIGIYTEALGRMITIAPSLLPCVLKWNSWRSASFRKGGR